MRLTTLPTYNKTTITIRKGLNGGVPFSISFSQRANGKFSLRQTENLLTRISKRLIKAPYAQFIKNKKPAIQFVITQDLIDMGYYNDQPPARTGFDAPEAKKKPTPPSGLYDGLKDIVYLNIDRLGSTSKQQIELLLHEFLHAYSRNIEYLDGNRRRIKIGLSTCTVKMVGEEITILEQKGQVLNEGLTELLRVSTVGRIRPTVYYRLHQAAQIIRGQLNNDSLIFRAFFENNRELFGQALNKQLGQGAFEQLESLAERLEYEEDQVDLIGFARYGFEYYIMKAWNYTPADRTNTPREISQENLPANLRQALANTSAKVITHLTDKDLSRLDVAANYPERHPDNTSFILFQTLPAQLAKFSGGAHLLIRYTFEKQESIITLDDPLLSPGTRFYSKMRGLLPKAPEHQRKPNQVHLMVVGFPENMIDKSQALDHSTNKFINISTVRLEH